MQLARSATTGFTLCACALAAAQTPAPAAAPRAVPAPYTAETTYAKLVRNYPFIRIARSELPASVRALRNITYIRRGEHALQLDLYLPAQPAAAAVSIALPATVPAKVPAIVLVHGGGWQSGVRENFAPMAIRMAENGFAAATISYRLSPEAPYPAAIHDVKAALRWVRAHAGDYGIDPARIAVGGGSAGGQIASLVGVTGGLANFDPDGAGSPVSSAAQAIVNIDGLSDFTSVAARKEEDNPAKQPSAAGLWFGGRYAEREAVWREASPTFHVGPRTPPVLFIGSAQARFSVGREEMAEKLRAQGIPTQTVLLPDTPHSFWLFDPWLAPTVDATVVFLRAHMPAQSPPENQ